MMVAIYLKVMGGGGDGGDTVRCGGGDDGESCGGDRCEKVVDVVVMMVVTRWRWWSEFLFNFS